MEAATEAVPINFLIPRFKVFSLGYWLLPVCLVTNLTANSRKLGQLYLKSESTKEKIKLNFSLSGAHMF